MRTLLTLFTIALSFQFLCAEETSAQILKEKNITYHVKNMHVKEVFNELSKISGFSFFYEESVLKDVKPISIQVDGTSMDMILSNISHQTGLSFKKTDNTISVSKQPVFTVSQNVNQDKKITGIVTDERGEALVGVSILEKGTTNGMATGLDGKFELTIQPNAILQITYIGYLAQEIQIGSQSSVTIRLKEDLQTLEEVVVVGYGVQKKVNLTGAISSVSGDELAKRTVGQTSIALQGIAPGLTITQSSGQPGQDVGKIRVRGVGTLNDPNPLVLVDGTEMDINSIDPNIIESISVLKDAASSSIYGSRAANGVILITTKRAKAGEFTISYNGYGGWQSPTDLPKRVGAIDHMVLLNEAYENVGKSPLFTEEMISNYIHNKESAPDEYPDVDWQKRVYKKEAFQHNHFLTLNGGTENMRLIGAIGIFNQQGIIPNSSYERYTVRLNSDMKFSSKLSAKLDMFFKYGDQKSPSDGVNNIAMWVNRTPAIYPEKLSDGRWAVGWDGSNASAMAKDGGVARSKTPSLSVNFGINYEVADFLQLEAIYVPSYRASMSSTFINSVSTYYPSGDLAYTKPSIAALYENRSYGLSHDFRFLVNAEKQFKNHFVKVLGGFSWESSSDDYINASRDTFIFPDYHKLNAGASKNQQAGGSGSEWAMASFFGRLNYDYKSKYLFEANLRYDGSSRFGKDKKWGLFPSFSAGWRISEETFWSPIKDVVSNLKLRASWGQLGNQNIGNYSFASIVNFNNYVVGGEAMTGGAIFNMSNPLIHWEKTEMVDIGLDVSLTNNLSMSFDYYDKKTTGILWQLNIPLIIGLEPTYQNAARVDNRGWDLELKYNNNIEDFEYGASFILSDVKNKVMDLRGVSMTGLTVNREGYAINSIYGLEAIGYISDKDYNADGSYMYATQFGAFAPGDIKYKDQNEDGIINEKDEVILGSTVPRFSYSLNINAAWKGFDISMFWQGVGKVDGYLNKYATMPFYWGATALEIHKDRWTPENQDARFPRFAFNEPNNEQNSSFWLKDASYLRLKNLQLGYTIPKKLIDKLKLKSCRLYISGQNLFTIDNFWKGYDVEAPIGDGSYFPQSRVYTIGLDIKF